MPVGAVIEAIDWFFDYMYSGNLSVGEVGKPPGTWFSATGWYYSGYGEKHYMSISITGNNDGEVAYSGDHIYIFTNPSVANLGSFDVSYWGGWAQLLSGNNFDFTAVLPDGTNQNVDVLTFALNLDTQQDSMWINDSTTALPAFGGGSFIGMKDDGSSFPVITNDNTLSDLGSSVIYVPIDGSIQYTYDDAMNIVLPALQVKFPDLTAADFKSESEIVYGDTEPTEETSSCGCSINYDEILSEGELESILNQETYELIPIETDTFEELQIVETLPGQIQNLPAELVTTSNSVIDYGSEVISELGLTPVYAPLLVFSLVCYILRGCA